MNPQQMTVVEMEEVYLLETISVLVDYDGFRTAESLKGLIDEVRDRLVKLSRHEVTVNDI